MSVPESNPDPDPVSMPTPAEMDRLGAGVVNAASKFMAFVPESRRGACLSCATAVALSAVRNYEPRSTLPAQLRWCGPAGEPAPAISFPKDFIDRRSTVAWSLYRLTVTTPVDEPIFSAQARVTVHDDGLATFSNFDAPAATFISSQRDSALPDWLQVPETIRRELNETATPLVYALMRQMAGFDDVILYTALLNFGRAFCAFQTGPWRKLKDALIGSHSMFAEQGFSVAERRAIERAALSAVELAWESSYFREVRFIIPAMVGILGVACSMAKA